MIPRASCPSSPPTGRPAMRRPGSRSGAVGGDSAGALAAAAAEGHASGFAGAGRRRSWLRAGRSRLINMGQAGLLRKFGPATGSSDREPVRFWISTEPSRSRRAWTPAKHAMRTDADGRRRRRVKSGERNRTDWEVSQQRRLAFLARQRTDQSGRAEGSSGTSRPSHVAGSRNPTWTGSRMWSGRRRSRRKRFLPGGSYRPPPLQRSLSPFASRALIVENNVSGWPSETSPWPTARGPRGRPRHGRGSTKSVS